MDDKKIVVTDKNLRKLENKDINALQELTKTEGFHVLLDLFKKRQEAIREKSVKGYLTGNPYNDYYNNGSNYGRYLSNKFIIELETNLKKEMNRRQS